MGLPIGSGNKDAGYKPGTILREGWKQIAKYKETETSFRQWQLNHQTGESMLMPFFSQTLEAARVLSKGTD
jgi:hypothetical protein